MDRSQLVTGGLLLVAIVLVPGLAKYALTQIGYGTLGTVIWYGGYGAGVLLVWALWLRPLDIVGPNDPSRPGE
ncbi:hypothetical protein [Halapricum desulfuricans]|uniref:Putative membrane protein n=1 Tax=Halapricum desulfuricans TaxID=2841257 RepID=A0A897N617_9EURY|nr:hypothetical protein [Halapricum desulfuricans]QSG09830.1 putative membrane protein [Halapricum desulfuricans]QSG11082.1 putative membrane protein [Halapricum desulfuricans]